jgi:hypothetical protein
MAIPAGFSRLVLHGLAGGDIFETGVWVRGAAGTQDAAQTLANNAWNLWLTTGLTGMAGLMSGDSSYTGLRAYCYPGGGPKAQFIAEAVASPAPGQGANHLPLQVALVVTLLTGAAGRSSRGRMYLPADGGTCGPDHQANDSTVDDACTAVAGWLTGLGGGNQTPVVLSTTNGTARDITQTRCDSKYDVQRRRANKQVARHQKLNTLG